LRDVVVTDKEDVDREVFRVEEELLLRRLDLDAAAVEQVEGVGGETAALLDGEAEAVLGEVGGRHGRKGKS
jgi:hypothetical protein